MNRGHGHGNRHDASTHAPTGAHVSPADGASARGTLPAAFSRRDAVAGVATSVALGAAGLPGQARARMPATPRRAATPRRRGRTATAFEAASQAPSEFTLPAALDAVPLDPRTGFDLPIGQFRVTFIPRAGLLGPDGDPQRLLTEPLVMGMVVTCLKEVWSIESAPAGDRTFTIAAYAVDEASEESGRLAVLAGQGLVAADGGGRVEFSLQTVPALAGSARFDQITASVAAQPDGSYEGQVEVTEVSAEKYGHGQRKCHRRCEGKSKAKKRRCKHRCRKHN
ncbi:MAG: hypothetical protein K0Q71_2507 [Thermomicrobiales bacterium]|jgi:hypothetical protein|nr:hypothetical protein [Thermomicrobiales bacterium]